MVLHFSCAKSHTLVEKWLKKSHLHYFILLRLQAVTKLSQQIAKLGETFLMIFKHLYLLLHKLIFCGCVRLVKIIGVNQTPYQFSLCIPLIFFALNNSRYVPIGLQLQRKTKHSRPDIRSSIHHRCVWNVSIYNYPRSTLRSPKWSMARTKVILKLISLHMIPIHCHPSSMHQQHIFFNCPQMHRARK